jgi:hypothetical protein
LFAQNTLNINGLNEAKFIYRTAPDSLNAYFYDSFAFNLAYRNFSFGMKFIAELPKYTTEQSELIGELDPNRLSYGWKELYASYSKDAYTIFAGTTEETFGNGLSFRSYKDIEFDEDHRIESFLVKYDEVLKFKAFYGAIESPGNVGKYDLAYGADAQYPLWDGFQIGASAVAFRNIDAMNHYNQRDVFSGRFNYNLGSLDLSGEYVSSELYHQPGIEPTTGKAIYATGSYNLGPLSLGGAYKEYDKFQYRLHDLPLANHHSETLSDGQASGQDEIGYQGYGTIDFGKNISLLVDYAEAWNSSKERRMNDAYTGIDWVGEGKSLGLSYSHIEKLDDLYQTWQKEMIPAATLGFTLADILMQLQGEYKVVTKDKQDVETTHYEPKMQADLPLGKLSLSLGAQSYWEDVSELMNSRYWASVEAKYPVAANTDVIIFAGKEAGGKVCRNGVCRYVAPFQGLKVELNTRF